MYGVDLLVKEHENIKRMAVVMRAASLHVLNGGDLAVEDFDKMVDFVRNYADKHHHKKEENILFDYMKKELGTVAEKLITHGMMVEHDLGRLHMMELDNALRAYEETGSQDAKLDIIANTMGYTYLINRHIDKENTVVFTFGEKNLDEKVQEVVNEKTRAMEDKATEEGLQDKYIKMLSELELKYVK
ncbi:MAG TPA: hemerythrin [Lachnospiraceae bacterium]|nr:hemerythrin domain-containing protein [uncultured Lachnoclostridium sp.]HAU84085.1 hemerythrin [Lachnospiraceae bacterium]